MATQFAFGKIVTNGLLLALDAADKNSYPGSGTAWRDLSGNNVNFTLTSSPTSFPTAAYSTLGGGSIEFNKGNTALSGSFATGSSNNDILRFSQTNFTGSAVTLCLWAYTTAGTGLSIYAGCGQTVLSQQPAYQIYKLGSNIVGAIVTNRSLIATSVSTPVTNNIWVNAAVTYDGANVRFYTNSTIRGTSARTGNMFTDYPVLIGAQYRNSDSLPGDNFSGSIANVMVYNRALSDQEILQNYNAQKSRFNLI
jgi:hypothetical protein